MRTMRSSELLALSTVIVAGLAPAPAGAQASTWSVTGAGCVPTGQTISGIGTFNSAGDSKFPTATAVGEIILTCPVPHSVAIATHLSVTYRDSDGPGNGVRLRAVLREKSLENGGVRDVAGVLGGAVFDSNAFPPAAAPATVRRSVQFANACSQRAFTFDHGRFTYYIQVNMTKRTRMPEVLLASVDLSAVTLC
jgi:hypothetical protein